MNNFEILSKLGEGAYSTVHKVKRLEDNNIYALKKVRLLNLSKKEKENSLNEVRILASVKSNFVISYKEAFFEEKDSSLVIVMEYADNGDLFQKITEHKHQKMYFEECDIWRILIQLIKGLKALHDLKILHRDLKSANVFLFKDGSAKLGDLNVSKVAKKGLGYTQTGTPYYASPEVWNEKPYNNKSDIWSLGCILYEMIMLHPPFRAENMEGLYNKVIKGKYPGIKSIFSNDLAQIVALLIQVDPQRRPSCEELLHNNIIQKRIEYFKSYSGVDDISEDKALLTTINIPKNLNFLGNNLPKPNYKQQKHFNSITLPSGNNANKFGDINSVKKNNTVLQSNNKIGIDGNDKKSEEIVKKEGNDIRKRSEGGYKEKKVLSERNSQHYKRNTISKEGIAETEGNVKVTKQQLVLPSLRNNYGRVREYNSPKGYENNVQRIHTILSKEEMEYERMRRIREVYQKYGGVKRTNIGKIRLKPIKRKIYNYNG